MTNSTPPAITELKKWVSQGACDAALTLCRSAAHPSDDFTTLNRLARELAKLPFTPTFKIALVGSSTLDHFVGPLTFWLRLHGISPDFFLAPYDTVEPSLLDSKSDLYAFQPDLIWVFTNYRDVRLDRTTSESQDPVEASLERVNALCTAIQKQTSAHLMINNADIPVERDLGNLEGNHPYGRLHALRRYNLSLPEHLPTGTVIFDLEHHSAVFGKARWHDAPYWLHSKHAFSMDAYSSVAAQASAIISSLRGSACKVLVLDLDNTLWGGVVADEGVAGIQLGEGTPEGEAFLAFQRYIKRLKTRGILLAVCSKNDDAIAREPFRQHPEMLLTEDDISVFVANWENKASNIQDIAETLNLSLSSFVFVDDNPAERKLVAEALPAVHVVDLPEDSALYVAALDTCGYFETTRVTKEDRDRNGMYASNIRRQEFKKETVDLDSYLRSLTMEALAAPINDLSLPRCAQLINKSNQFHLTTTRFSDTELTELLEQPDIIGRSYRLRDCFGDNGLISSVILRITASTATVQTWVMSCRVLSRGMEDFIHADICACARDHDCTTLEGLYIPTQRNNMVKDLYSRLGHQQPSNKPSGAWVLDLAAHTPLTTPFINTRTQQEWDAHRVPTNGG